MTAQNEPGPKTLLFITSRRYHYSRVDNAVINYHRLRRRRFEYLFVCFFFFLLRLSHTYDRPAVAAACFCCIATAGRSSFSSPLSPLAGGRECPQSMCSTAAEASSPLDNIAAHIHLLSLEVLPRGSTPISDKQT